MIPRKILSPWRGAARDPCATANAKILFDVAACRSHAPVRLIEGNKFLRRLAKPLFRYLYLIATGKFALHPEWFQIAGHVIPKMNRK